MIYSIQGVVFVGVFPAIAALVMANAAFRRHRAFVASRSSPQAVLTRGFNRISRSAAL